ncbi:hypothetical protein pb186bvf_002956 [Paramecium bursaria]
MIFTRERHLGTGAFGEVYQIKDTQTQKYYACKIISKTKMITHKVENMIKQEILIQQSLSHKNVLKLIECQEDNDYIYIILEYCSKGCLTFPNTPLPQEQIFNIIVQIMQGLDYIHQKQIIHRDIKLENILIHEDGTLKISDFGWATTLQNVKPTSVICGTTQYMPPEAVMKKNHDQKVDVFSLGVLIYTLLHAQFPFKGPNQETIIGEILNKQILLNKNLDEDLQIAIQAMLTKKAEIRPTVQQLFISKYMKREMRRNNLFNRYENEALKAKINKNTQIKTVTQALSIPIKQDQLSLSSYSTQKSVSTNPSPMVSRITDQIFKFQEDFTNIQMPL